MALNLARNSRLFVSTVTSGFSDTNTWEIQIQDGFSFSQGNSTQEISADEAGASPTRGSKTFNSSLDPADWSFAAYVRPFYDTTNHQAVERILWAGLAAAQTPDFADSGNAVTGTPSQFSVNFGNSDVHELLKLNLYWQLDNIWYLISDCQVNQAEIDFSIDGISMITWSGQGIQQTDVTGGTHPDPALIAAVPTSSYLKNKLSTLVLAAGSPTVNISAISGDATTVTVDVDAPHLLTPGDSVTIAGTVNHNGTYTVSGVTDDDTFTYLSATTDAEATGTVTASNTQADSGTVYDIAITGGSLTIANNITYLTPETLSIVDVPCGSFTGARSVSGNLTCYLNDKANGSSTLLKNLATSTDTTNNYSMVLSMGGPTAPRVTFFLPTAHLSIPSVDIQDVVGLSVDFAGQGSTGLTSTDELSINYYAQ